MMRLIRCHAACGVVINSGQVGATVEIARRSAGIGASNGGSVRMGLGGFVRKGKWGMQWGLAENIVPPPCPSPDLFGNAA